MANKNLPTKTWVNPRWANTPDWARPIIQSLEQFLARPQFYNGVDVGDGTPPTKDQEGVVTKPPLADWGKTAIEAMESALASIGTDLESVYATLATMQSDLDELETAPIAFTRITDVSISTPMLQANSVTATQLAAMNLGVGKWIASTSYSAGSSGWMIAADGTAEFNNVTVRGTVVAASGAVTLNTSGISISGGTSSIARVKWMNGGSVAAYIGASAGGAFDVSAPGGFSVNGHVSASSLFLSGGVVSSLGHTSHDTLNAQSIHSYGSLSGATLRIASGNMEVDGSGIIYSPQAKLGNLQLLSDGSYFGVSAGANNSGGTGFRLLRIANS